MSYQIIWDTQSKDFLKKLENKEAQRIIKKVNSISVNPMRYLDTLVQIDAYKLRVGDYRILIDLDNEHKFMNIVFIGHRKNIYKYIDKPGKFQK